MCQCFSGSGVWACDPECKISVRGKAQRAIVVEADFLWDPVGGDDVFRENR